MMSLSDVSYWRGCLTIVILISIHHQTYLIQAAPPQPQHPISPQQSANQVQDVKAESLVGPKSDLDLVQGSDQKTANLSPLINETLKINNKSAVVANVAVVHRPNFREDWTFDRVEYDLMDFLRELNARYSYVNSTTQQVEVSAPEPTALLERRRDNVEFSDSSGQRADQVVKKADDLRSKSPKQQQQAVPLETITKTTVEAVKKELDEVFPVNKQASESSGRVKSLKDNPTPTIVTSPTSSELPISLASGDHDISESTWQYGIFDRFTRPRASTSTTTPVPDSLLAVGSSANIDTRSFNSEECGLRSYQTEADYFPGVDRGGQLDTDEMTKELSQRRQRPPLGSSYFSSHKKYHHSGSGVDSHGLADELDSDKVSAEQPPYDRYGEPAGLTDELEPQTSSKKQQPFQVGTSLTEEANTSADSEFNLSLRRQWLQQQLGSTLQILGFNATNNNDHLNRTHNTRENMMKMSSKRKRGRVYVMNGEPGASPPGGQSPELSEQELKARQDELKLEARVIGGNDARLGDSPWSASLQALVSRPGTGGVEYRHYCGGTIISEYYILTAAHCLDFMVGRESRLFVVIGDLNWRMSAASLHGRRFGIEKLIIHGGYKSTAFGHDIGLIKTKESMKPLKVNGRYIVNSVCLPERNIEHMGEAELVGWGLFSNRNEMADSLQIADVPILPRPLCVDLYRRRTGLIQWLIGIELITEKQICAGTFGRGICQGDSGSALVFNEKVSMGGEGVNNKPTTSSTNVGRLKNNLLRDHQQRATIIGTVAFGGIRRCSYQSLPGVYMQTSKYLDWILPRIQ